MPAAWKDVSTVMRARKERSSTKERRRKVSYLGRPAQEVAASAPSERRCSSAAATAGRGRDWAVPCQRPRKSAATEVRSQWREKTMPSRMICLRAGEGGWPRRGGKGGGQSEEEREGFESREEWDDGGCRAYWGSGEAAEISEGMWTSLPRGPFGPCESPCMRARVLRRGC